jgi:hypothetical protein
MPIQDPFEPVEKGLKRGNFYNLTKKTYYHD